MKHRKLAGLIGFSCWIGLSGTAFAQSATSTALKFEVASLKPAAVQGPDDNTFRRAPGGQRIEAHGATLKRLIELAYGVSTDQIEGEPAWADRDRFNLEAKAERSASAEELWAMLQNLLIERFHLRVRSERRLANWDVLTVADDGPKMVRHDQKDRGGARL